MAIPVRASDKAAAARNIRMIVLDVDGVLTDGSIMLDDNGVETKRFNVRDGQGLAAWIKMGFEIAVITRRSGQAGDPLQRHVEDVHVAAAPELLIEFRRTQLDGP